MAALKVKLMLGACRCTVYTTLAVYGVYFVQHLPQL